MYACSKKHFQWNCDNLSDVKSQFKNYKDFYHILPVCVSKPNCCIVATQLSKPPNSDIANFISKNGKSIESLSNTLIVEPLYDSVNRFGTLPVGHWCKQFNFARLLFTWRYVHFMILFFISSKFLFSLLYVVSLKLLGAMKTNFTIVKLK